MSATDSSKPLCWFESARSARESGNDRCQFVRVDRLWAGTLETQTTAPSLHRPCTNAERDRGQIPRVVPVFAKLPNQVER